MSEILSIGGNGTPLQGITNRRSAAASYQPVAGRLGDSAEFSSTAQLLAKLAGLPDVRQDKVDSIKSQIAAGSYDADGDKLDQALESMMNDMLGS
jgi:flagellar biosynthesis anti-sigma factor FlgM